MNEKKLKKAPARVQLSVFEKGEKTTDEPHTQGFACRHIGIFANFAVKSEHVTLPAAKRRQCLDNNTCV